MIGHPRSFLERQLISKGNSISMECQWSSIPRYWWILQIHGIIEPYFEKLPALALCSSASVPSPWLLLFLVASSFYEQTICAFQTAMLRPLTTSCFFKRNAIVSLWLSQKVWAQVPIHDKHMLNCFFWICLKKCLSKAPSQKTFPQSNFSQQTTAKGHG